MGTAKITARNAIIIGFVGGFVRQDDKKHPEVKFAAYLRERYPSTVDAEVFANHNRKQAFRRVLQLLETNQHGVLTTSAKEQASIIIYDHSWGLRKQSRWPANWGGWIFQCHSPSKWTVFIN